MQSHGSNWDNNFINTDTEAYSHAAITDNTLSFMSGESIGVFKNICNFDNVFTTAIVRPSQVSNFDNVLTATAFVESPHVSNVGNVFNSTIPDNVAPQGHAYNGLNITLNTDIPNTMDLPNDSSSYDKALMAAVKDNSFSPLIKHDLALKVRQKRMSEGKGDFTELFESPKYYQLTEEEKMKIEIRKKRNRASAEKARIKRKQQEEYLNQECHQLEDEQRSINAEIRALNQQLKEYKKILYGHVILGRYKGSPCRHPKFNKIGLKGKTSCSSPRLCMIGDPVETPCFSPGLNMTEVPGETPGFSPLLSIVGTPGNSMMNT